jgi:hypothetical protein
MVWDVIVAAAFVVVSVAVLVCFAVKLLLTWLKKPHQGISQHRLFDLIALYATVQYETQIAGHKLTQEKRPTAPEFKRRMI